MIETIINPHKIFDSTGQAYIFPLLFITLILIIGAYIHEKNCSKNNH